MATYLFDKETQKWIPAAEHSEKYGRNKGRNEKMAGSALWGDRHYENMVVHGASNGGVNIVNSRKQHRQFMKDNNLTTIDDYGGGKGMHERAKKHHKDRHEANAKERRRDLVNTYKQVMGKL